MWKPYAPSICSSNLTGIWCFIRQSCGRELCEARVGGRHWGTAQRHPVGPSGSLPLSADCCPCRQPPPTWPRAPCWWPPLGSWMPLACPCPALQACCLAMLCLVLQLPQSALMSWLFPQCGRATHNTDHTPTIHPSAHGTPIGSEPAGPPANPTRPRLQARGIRVATNPLSSSSPLQDPFPGVKTQTVAGRV